MSNFNADITWKVKVNENDDEVEEVMAKQKSKTSNKRAKTDEYNQKYLLS